VRRKLTPTYDLAIVGSGVAGLYGALCAAAEARVLIVSKGPVLTSSSWLAQGGVAAATAPGD
jgi:aspartate oxidase